MPACLLDVVPFGAPGKAERVAVTFQEADAEALPFADASFDVLLSTVGVMFTPRQEQAASELLRVCRQARENQLGANYYKNEKSIGLAIYKQSNGNTIKVVDAIYDQLPRYRAPIPLSVRMTVRRPLGVDPDAVKDMQVTLRSRSCWSWP